MIDEPIRFMRNDLIDAKLFALSDRDRVLPGVLAHDVDRMTQRDPNSLALSDGEVLVTGVRADFTAFAIEDCAGPDLLWRSARDEAGVIVVGHEADFLRIRLIEDGEIEFARQAADFALLVAA